MNELEALLAMMIGQNPEAMAKAVPPVVKNEPKPKPQQYEPNTRLGNSQGNPLPQNDLMRLLLGNVNNAAPAMVAQAPVTLPPVETSSKPIQARLDPTNPATAIQWAAGNQRPTQALGPSTEVVQVPVPGSEGISPPMPVESASTSPVVSPAIADTVDPDAMKMAAEASLGEMLSGIQAPAAPQGQRISTPSAPQMPRVQSGVLLDLLLNMARGPAGKGAPNVPNLTKMMWG